MPSGEESVREEMKWLSWIGVPALTFAYYGQYPYRLLIEQGTYQLADSSSGRYVAQTTTKGAGRFAVGCYRTPILPGNSRALRAGRSSEEREAAAKKVEMPIASSTKTT